LVVVAGSSVVVAGSSVVAVVVSSVVVTDVVSAVVEVSGGGAVLANVNVAAVFFVEPAVWVTGSLTSSEPVPQLQRISMAKTKQKLRKIFFFMK